MIAGGNHNSMNSPLTMLDFFENVNVLFRPQNTAKKGEKPQNKHKHT